MYFIFDTLFALFSAYGVVFFLWWIVAIILSRHISPANVRIYINWLKFGGIFPPELTKEDLDGTRTNDN